MPESNQHRRMREDAIIAQLEAERRTSAEYDRENTILSGKVQGLEEQLQAAQQKNEKLSALIIEQEGQYRDEKRGLIKQLEAVERERDELRQLVSGYTADVDHYADEAQKYRDELYKAGWSDPADSIPAKSPEHRPDCGRRDSHEAPRECAAD